MKRKKALKAAKRLKKYCESREYCSGCALYHIDKGCILTGHLPEEWKIPK